MESTDVLVVGAGPTGLTLACELRRYGVGVRVIDAAAQGSVHSKALVVHARTQEVFACMGLGEAVAAEAQRLLRVHMFHEGKKLGTMAIGDLPAEVPKPAMLDQSTTERLLAAYLERLGGAVERECRLVAFRDEAERVICTVQGAAGHEEVITARWLVGCDGAHSAVRHGLGLPFEGAAYEDMFDQADVKLGGEGAPGDAFGFLRPKGLCVVLPLPRGRHRIMIIGGDGHAPEPTLEMFQALLRELLPGAVIEEAEWIVRFRLHRRIAPRMAVGRVFLAGDAAHIHSPAGGQGMNTGIQDAYALAWRLALVARGGAREALLASYHEERHPVAVEVLRSTDRMFRMALTGRPSLLWLRRTLIRFVLGRPALQRRMAGKMSQLGVTYRQAPTVLDARGWRRPPPRAGDRVPAATLAGPDGELSLHEWLARSPRLSLLLMHGWRRTPALTAIGDEVARRWGCAVEVRDVVSEGREGEALGDGGGALHRAWGVRGPELALVRPDGHVAVRASLARASRLQAHLERWFSGG